MYPIVLSGAGEVLDLGRAQRLANRAQRRALRALYRTCGATGCEVPFDRCEVHHIHWWDNGGPTDLRNLVPLCSRHHHLVHDHGWQVQLDEARTLHLQRPDGTWDSSQPLRPMTDGPVNGDTSSGTSPPGSSPPTSGPPSAGPPGDRSSLEQLTLVG